MLVYSVQGRASNSIFMTSEAKQRKPFQLINLSTVYNEIQATDLYNCSKESQFAQYV